MVLPSLNSGATEAWTQCPVLTPHHLDKDDRGRRATFYGKDALSSNDVRNIGRFANSPYPPKGLSRWERAGRELWIGQVKSRKGLDMESTRRDVESKGKQKQ